MIKIAKKRTTLPMRLQLPGPDALHLVRSKCETVLRDAEKWEALSRSTSADDADLEFPLKVGPPLCRELVLGICWSYGRSLELIASLLPYMYLPCD